MTCLLGGPGPTIPKLDVTIKLAENEQQYRAVLRDVHKRRLTNIILDLEPAEVLIILKKALQLGMINSSYNYVLTSLVGLVPLPLILVPKLDHWSYNFKRNLREKIGAIFLNDYIQD